MPRRTVACPAGLTVSGLTAPTGLGCKPSMARITGRVGSLTQASNNGRSAFELEL